LICEAGYTDWMTTYRGLVHFPNEGTYCFGVTGEHVEGSNCGVVFLPELSEAGVTHDSEKPLCVQAKAGDRAAIEMRWLQYGLKGQGFNVLWCNSSDAACVPKTPLPDVVLQGG
jgi:hypothetical protein